MIQVKKIEPQTVRALGPMNEDLGLLNEYEFTDLRAQISEEGQEGYSIIYNSENIPIDKNGRLNFPRDLFRSIPDSLTRLLTRRPKT